jgi:hypothetical protein
MLGRHLRLCSEEYCLVIHALAEFITGTAHPFIREWSTVSLRSGTRRRIRDSGQQASREFADFSAEPLAKSTKTIEGAGQCDSA